MVRPLPSTETPRRGCDREATVTSGEVVTVYVPLVAHSCSILPTFATVYSSPYSSDYAFAVQQAANGHYLVAGRAKPAGDPIYFDVWIMDLNLDGSIAWQKLYDGVRWNRARALQARVKAAMWCWRRRAAQRALMRMFGCSSWMPAGT